MFVSIFCFSQFAQNLLKFAQKFYSKLLCVYVTVYASSMHQVQIE